MTEVHSFFIPDPEFLIDLQGLIEYLGAKVSRVVYFLIHIQGLIEYLGAKVSKVV